MRIKRITKGTVSITSRAQSSGVLAIAACDFISPLRLSIVQPWGQPAEIFSVVLNTNCSCYEQKMYLHTCALSRPCRVERRFYISMTKPSFDDIWVRQAFLHAIDRQAIKDTLYPGSLAQLAVSPLPPGYFGHIPVAIPEYDSEKAKKLLAEAGHPNGFTIKDYFMSKSFFFPKMMTLVQEQLKKIGINVEVQLVEHPTYHENIRKNLNPFVLYGGTRLTDGDVWLSLFFSSQEIPDPATGNKGTNFAHYRGIDDLLEQGRRERDQEKRARLYHEAQQRMIRSRRGQSGSGRRWRGS